MNDTLALTQWYLAHETELSLCTWNGTKNVKQDINDGYLLTKL